MNKLDVKGVIFDYGGTLDTRGDHWSEVLWDGYQHMNVEVKKEDFRKAYVHGERSLATNPIIQPDFHFVDVLRAKNKLQLDYLTENGMLQLSNLAKVDLAERMALYENEQTNEVLEESKSVLEYLKDRYPMVLVSNFYGNINTILSDAGIDHYFKRVIESAVVGVRKPNPAIFALGVCALDLPASQVVVVGDTFDKDIAPAHSLGCRTVWIKGLQWEEKPCDETMPDGIISRITELKNYL
ncbi:MAG: HAD family hydrolase [Prevotella sp.]|nr:HAD family hydrolase [Prevotella sp.]MDD7047108.1 HAD family hydrolase [Prevotella sp.]MDY5547540.1 HAD family hydrolase [Prevotella sp.]